MDWEEKWLSPSLEAIYRKLDFLVSFHPIATNQFSQRKQHYFAKHIRQETQREVLKIIGCGASKFIKFELGKRWVTGLIRENINDYVRMAFSTLTNGSHW